MPLTSGPGATAIAPAPAGRLLTGHLAEFRADRLAFFTRCAREHGDVVPLRLLGFRVLLLSRPDLIEEVLVTQAKNFVKHFGLRLYKPILGNGLVTSEGDLWRRQRKLSAPAFQGSRLAGYAREMVSPASRMADAWEELSKDAVTPESGRVRDVHADMMRLTLEIACRTLFGADACPDPAAVGRAMEEGLEAIENRFRGPFPLPAWVPTPSNLRLRRVMRSLHGVINDIIARRRSAAGRSAPSCGAGFQPAAEEVQAESLHHSSPDLLTTLLDARDDDGSGMTGPQLLDETLTIFLAGHETTALALTYSMYLLALHPQAQAKLRSELSSVLGDRPAEYADLANLTYTRNVVSESMRLYPPADFLGREAINDCTVGGVTVRRGTNLFMSQWVMHHDPRYFTDPDTFDPDRWTPEFERNLPRYAYFPFGGGQRYCIGQTFALAEAALVLATLCRRFSFASEPSYRLELWPSITLRPRQGVRLRVTPARSG